ncbi:MAG: hypothetical protein ACJA13_002951 [Paraglaciecola sp.]|jgi:hypothetical protein
MTSTGPQFVGIGAQRSGTSWLYECLNEHPDVFMPQKEVHYFDKLSKTKNIDWYSNLFKNSDENKITGEITPDYMFHQYTIAELHKHFPDTKIIIILRNPLERSYSAYNLFKSHGRFQNINFNEALKAEPFLLEQSLYFEQIKNVYKYFPKEQVLIKFYDDIASQPLKFYQSVCDFLGLNSSFTPVSLKKIKNSSAMSSVQNKLNLPVFQKRIEQSVFKRPFKVLKTTKMANWLKRKLILKDNKNIIVDEVIQEKLAQDIKMLESLLKIQLNHWCDNSLKR